MNMAKVWVVSKIPFWTKFIVGYYFSYLDNFSCYYPTNVCPKRNNIKKEVKRKTICLD